MCAVLLFQPFEFSYVEPHIVVVVDVGSLAV